MNTDSQINETPANPSQEEQPLSPVTFGDDTPALILTGEPGLHDVLCGRGVTTNRHAGNVQYRSLVALNKVRLDDL